MCTSPPPTSAVQSTLGRSEADHTSTDRDCGRWVRRGSHRASIKTTSLCLQSLFFFKAAPVPLAGYRGGRARRQSANGRMRRGSASGAYPARLWVWDDGRRDRG